MTIPQELEGILASDPETFSGSVRFQRHWDAGPSFAGRLTCNHHVGYLLEGFPEETREQARSVVSWEPLLTDLEYLLALTDQLAACLSGGLLPGNSTVIEPSDT